jgi:hypothetical protein
MHAEIERQYFRKFEAVLFQRPLDDEQFPPRRESFVPSCPIDRTLGNATSTLGTGEDIVGNAFEALRNHGNPVAKCLFRDEGKEFEHEPLGCGKLKVEDPSTEEHSLKGT